LSDSAKNTSAGALENIIDDLGDFVTTTDIAPFSGVAFTAATEKYACSVNFNASVSDKSIARTPNVATTGAFVASIRHLLPGFVASAATNLLDSPESTTFAFFSIGAILNQIENTRFPVTFPNVSWSSATDITLDSSCCAIIAAIATTDEDQPSDFFSDIAVINTLEASLGFAIASASNIFLEIAKRASAQTGVSSASGVTVQVIDGSATPDVACRPGYRLNSWASWHNTSDMCASVAAAVSLEVGSGINVEVIASRATPNHLTFSTSAGTTTPINAHDAATFFDIASGGDSQISISSALGILGENSAFAFDSAFLDDSASGASRSLPVQLGDGDAHDFEETRASDSSDWPWAAAWSDNPADHAFVASARPLVVEVSRNEATTKTAAATEAFSILYTFSSLAVHFSDVGSAPLPADDSVTSSESDVAD